MRAARSGGLRHKGKMTIYNQVAQITLDLIIQGQFAFLIYFEKVVFHRYIDVNTSIIIKILIV